MNNHTQAKRRDEKGKHKRDQNLSRVCCEDADGDAEVREGDVSAVQEDEGADVLVLGEDSRVLKVGEELLEALDAGVGELADLVAAEAVPALVVERGVEGRDVRGADGVDKGVADATATAEVDGQVQEVVATRAVAVELRAQHLLCAPVRDVADHQRRARVRNSSVHNVHIRAGRKVLQRTSTVASAGRSA